MHLRSLILGLALALVPSTAYSLAPPATGATCPQGRITEIRILNHGLFDPDDMVQAGRWAWAYRTAERLHARTRPGFIRRELLMREGDCFDPELAAESERLLRAAPFIARAEVDAFAAGSGDVRVSVVVWDDWSLWVIPQGDPHDALVPIGVEAYEENLAGTGQFVGIHYFERYDEAWWGASYRNPQLAGTRLQAEVRAGSSPIGAQVEQALFWPFVGVRGRWAFRQHAAVDDRYFEFVAVGARHPLYVLVPERRRAGDLGGVYRFRQQDRTALLGFAFAGEWIDYPGESRFYRRSGEFMDSDTVGIDREGITSGLDRVSTMRAVLLAGHRDVRFVPRVGLDAVRGVQDVKLGTEVEFGIGRSIEMLSTTDDMSLDFGVFASTEWTDGLIIGTQWHAEGKRDYGAPADEGEWRDMFAHLAAWVYYRPGEEERTLWVGSLQLAGGWKTTVPFQLTLDRDTGVRGRAAVGLGARRLVGSLEHRFALRGPLPNLLDLGTVVFVDAGRIWPGEVPFSSEERETRISVGAGLRAGFPTGSSRAYRLDVAMPLVATGGARRIEIRASTGQAVGMGLAHPYQIERSSRRSLGTSLFAYPN